MSLRTPLFNDAKSYGFEYLRQLAELALQEGVLAAGDMKVTAAAAGGQRVDIAAGVALVKGDSGTPATGLSQGLYTVINDAAVANAATLNASDVTNPRIDQIVLKVRDSSDLGNGGDDALFEVVTGAPTAGATLDNRNGAAALGNDRLRLADVLVPAASAAVTAGNVRDRRPWARGASGRIIDSSGDLNLTIGAATGVGTPLRLELSGVPVRIMLLAVLESFTAANARAWMNLAIDGTGVYGVNQQYTIPVVGIDIQVTHNIERIALAAGSHTFQQQWGEQVNDVQIKRTADRPLVTVVEEIVRQNADNT